MRRAAFYVPIFSINTTNDVYFLQESNNFKFL